MSYYLNTRVDSPYCLLMLDGSFTDTSGRSVTVNSTGSVAYGNPLVAGAAKSTNFGSGANVSFAFPRFNQSYESKAFTLEAWFFPKGNTRIISHGTTGDGLTYTNGELKFGVTFASGSPAEAKFKPSSKYAMHVVGVYTNNSILLYVNGKLEDSYFFSDAQRAAGLANTGTTLSVGGTGEGYLQAVAVYQSAFDQAKVTNHYQSGIETTDPFIVSGYFAGKLIEASEKTANIFFKKDWPDWKLGFTDARIDDLVLKSPVDPDDGTYNAATWTGSFELDAGGTSIEQIQADWVSEGTVTVQTSLDGTNWSSLTNHGMVSGITSGYNPAGKVLQIRVSFTDNTYGEMSYLKVTGVKDMSIKTSPDLPINVTANTLVYPMDKLNDYEKNKGLGVIATDSINIGPNAETDFTGYQSLGLWYYLEPGGALTTNFPINVFYLDGVSTGISVPEGRWVYLVITSNSPYTSLVALQGTNASFAYITLYPTQLTADQVSYLFNAYTGKPRFGNNETTIGSIQDHSATIYSQTWSIQPAG